MSTEKSYCCPDAYLYLIYTGRSHSNDLGQIQHKYFLIRVCMCVCFSVCEYAWTVFVEWKEKAGAYTPKQFRFQLGMAGEAWETSF